MGLELNSAGKWISQARFKYLQSIVEMHDIYQTDKLSTDMGENSVIFIALINK